MQPDSNPAGPFFAIPVAVPTTAVGVALMGGDLLLTGWAFRETTGAAIAVVELYDGNDATGTLIAPIVLQANESTRDLMGGIPLLCRVGLYVNIVAGTVKGSCWVVDV